MAEQLDIEGVFNFKVDDLKNELGKRGLPKNGSKTDLQERLLQYVTMDNSLVNDEKLKDSIEESLDKSDLLEESLDTVMNLDSTKDSKDTMIDPSGNAEYEDIDIDAVDIIIDKTDAGKDIKTNNIVAKKGITSKCDQDKSVPKVVKISACSMTNGEKRENRSKRFGEASSEAEKKKIRLGRFSSSISGVVKGNEKEVDKVKARAERFSSGSTMLTNPAVSVVDRLKVRQERFADVNLKKRQERFGTTNNRSLNLNSDMNARKQNRLHKFGTVQ